MSKQFIHNHMIIAYLHDRLSNSIHAWATSQTANAFTRNVTIASELYVQSGHCIVKLRPSIIYRASVTFESFARRDGATVTLHLCDQVGFCREWLAREVRTKYKTVSVNPSLEGLFYEGLAPNTIADLKSMLRLPA